LDGTLDPNAPDYKEQFKEQFEARLAQEGTGPLLGEVARVYWLLQRLEGL